MIFLFPIQSPNRTLSSLQLGFRFMVCQNIHLGCRGSWFDLKSGLFCPRLSQTLLCNSTKINNQLWFSIGSPNCSLSTFPGWGWVGGSVGVGKCVSKENPKSDLDLDLWFVNIENESCSTTWVDPKTFVKPYSDPQFSPLGPLKTKMTPTLSQIQMSEFKQS